MRRSPTSRPTRSAQSKSRRRNGGSFAPVSAIRPAMLSYSRGTLAMTVGFASAMSGPSAITGEGVVWGATMAVEELNARGGIMGRKVEVLYGDYQGGQRVVSRFGLSPREDGGWLASVARHWNVDRASPR